jgi:ribosomal 50S subunit-recycling heat shock protein
MMPMRIDLALKYLCLSKSRSSVKTLCDKDLLHINGRTAKPSQDLRAGDRVTMERRGDPLTVEILRVPDKQLSKKDAREYYRVVHE